MIRATFYFTADPVNQVLWKASKAGMAKLLLLYVQLVLVL